MGELGKMLPIETQHNEQVKVGYYNGKLYKLTSKATDTFGTFKHNAAPTTNITFNVITRNWQGKQNLFITYGDYIFDENDNKFCLVYGDVYATDANGFPGTSPTRKGTL